MSRKERQAFTLIEILIVITIIALLASLVAPKLFSKLGSSKQKIAETQIHLIENALDAFKLDVGRYPTSQEGLEALWKNPGVEGWDGPYLPRPVKKDPWGNPYIYESPGKHGEYDLYSLGADGKPGGRGENKDITNWEDNE